MSPPFLASAVRLPVLFALLTGIPLAVLGWLGWRVLEQERTLEAQQVREHLENTATLVSRELERALGAWEHAASAVDSAALVPPGVVVLRFDQHGITERYGTSLPYYPAVRAEPLPDGAIFARAEALEFREGDLGRALAEYRRLAGASDRQVRAAALTRVARCLRKQGHVRSALDVYGRLLALGGVTVAGSPSELVARRERAALFAAVGEPEAADRERSELAAALTQSRFLIDRSTFDFFRASLPESRPAIDSALHDAFELAAAADAFWRSWQDISQQNRTTWMDDDRAYVAVWRPAGVNAGATIGRVETLIGPAAGLVDSARVRVGIALDDRSGRRLWGDSGPAASSASRSLGAIGLPWTLHVAASDPATAQSAWISRRNLFAAGFGLMTLIIAAAGYFVFRAVNQELRVARLQSDFVAAVSHEFRTPLTAISHLAEVLDEGSAEPDRLRRYYRALRAESRRLQAMIEGLLDFGRIEAGRRTYELVDTDAAALVASAVREFRDRALTSHQLVLRTLPAAACHLRCDPGALLIAIRNLIDNAIKYSPDHSTITVSVARSDGFVSIAVQDEGPGLSRAERRAVFRKFVRGSAARARNVKGTGIGLTMAVAIVKGHGGRLEVTSDPGRGSRFGIVLPVAGALRERSGLRLHNTHDEREPA